ncbi:siderophore-iron reductase FhuF [Pandoraea terrigena]|uniref:Siderophore-iron reductase FhuF n=1 Tax=Pandoraea terrigena TaxID=2508292 RepID=A0A5E4UWK2_9BURK|nr:siderophore-iron reductase FhuF [Pandoraea terrigena]VVE03325.1 siderophore-iron reductase FhuF [Pandoraea terrigena]
MSARAGQPVTPAPVSAAQFDLAGSLPDIVRAELGPLCTGLAFGARMPVDLHEGDIVVGLADLGDHLPAMFEGVRRIVPGVEPRALMSQWSKCYFRAVVPAALAIAVVHGSVLTLDPDACGVVLRDGLPVQLRFPADSWTPPPSRDHKAFVPPPAAQRFASLIHVHLPAAIAAMQGAAGVSPRVLWGNVGNLLEFIVERMRHVPSLAIRAAADYAWLFDDDAGFGRTADNPLYRTVRYMSSPSPALASPMRARRVCCLRYQLAGKGTRCDEALLCGACPLLLTMTPSQLHRQLAWQVADDAPQ